MDVCKSSCVCVCDCENGHVVSSHGGASQTAEEATYGVERCAAVRTDEFLDLLVRDLLTPARRGDGRSESGFGRREKVRTWSGSASPMWKKSFVLAVEFALGSRMFLTRFVRPIHIENRTPRMRTFISFSEAKKLQGARVSDMPCERRRVRRTWDR